MTKNQNAAPSSHDLTMAALYLRLLANQLEDAAHFRRAKPADKDLYRRCVEITAQDLESVTELLSDSDNDLRIQAARLTRRAAASVRAFLGGESLTEEEVVVLAKEAESIEVRARAQAQDLDLVAA